MFELPADGVAARGQARGVGEARGAAVVPVGHLLGGDGDFGEPAVPFHDGVAGTFPVLVDLLAGVPLVGGGVGVSLREDLVADDPVVGVLLAQPRRPGDDEPAVPVVGQPDHELTVVVPVVVGVGRGGIGEVAVDLDPGDPGRGRGAGGLQTRPVDGVGVPGGDRARRAQVGETGGDGVLGTRDPYAVGGPSGRPPGPSAGRPVRPGQRAALNRSEEENGHRARAASRR